jgi:hypothetical protein
LLKEFYENKTIPAHFPGRPEKPYDKTYASSDVSLLYRVGVLVCMYLLAKLQYHLLSRYHMLRMATMLMSVLFLISPIWRGMDNLELLIHKYSQQTFHPATPTRTADSKHED